MRSLFPKTAILSAILPLSAQLSGTPVIEGIGDIAEGEARSEVICLSADGTYVGGFGSSEFTPSPSEGNPDPRPVPTREAVRWSSGSGLEELGFLPFSKSSSSLSGLSADGSIGAGSAASGLGLTRAVRWTPSTGFQRIDTLAEDDGFIVSEGRAISDDGERIVGFSSSSQGFRAFLWISTSGATGNITNLGVLRNGSLSAFSVAQGISGDGKVVVGSSTFQDGTPGTEPGDPADITDSGTEAFSWDQTNKLVGLGDLEGGPTASEAFAASEDGSVIVGYGSPEEGSSVAVVWIDGSLIEVGDLPGGDSNSQLFDVSADGTMAVGTGTKESGPSAIVWDPGNGIRELTPLLLDLGVDLEGWTLFSATTISADGNTIAGDGISPEGDLEGWRIEGVADIFLPALPAVDFSFGRVVSFSTRPGNMYQLESSTDGVIFSPVGDPVDTANLGSGGSHDTVDPNYTDETQYRVILLPGSPLPTPPVPIVSQGTVLSLTTLPGYVYGLRRSENLMIWEDVGLPLSTETDVGPVEQTLFHPFKVFPSPVPPSAQYQVTVSTP